MASHSGRISNVSSVDSGFGGSIRRPVDPRYACNWTNDCRGNHELDDCEIRRRELRGKLGIYHSKSGGWKRFQSCQIGHYLPLDSNPTGHTIIHLLIYTIRNDQPWVLFATRWLKEKRNKFTESNRQLLLTFPTFYPSRRDEYPKAIALKALRTITDWPESLEQFRSRLRGFLFVDANVIYPLKLTNDQADNLTAKFSPNDVATSIHWFPLSTIDDNLPQQNDNLIPAPSNNELPQVKRIDRISVRLLEGGQHYKMWSVTASALFRIKHHVGFNEFLA